MTVATSFFDVVLAVHIMAVVFAFGATLAYPVLLGTIAKADSRALPALYKALHAISIRVIMPGLTVVLIAGIYMASDAKLWSEFFVQWGLGAVVAIGAVEGMFLSPNEKKLVEVADRDLAASGDGQAHRRNRRHDGPDRAAHDLVHGDQAVAVLGVPPRGGTLDGI
jgi:hypothetical protein